MNDCTLLTISIPTYNRAKYLDLCLDRINIEINSLNEEQKRLVKVCVADNGSTDNTAEIVAKHQANIGERFMSVRASNNMGMDFNFTRCYELAKSPYVWLVGDDDVLLPGGLRKVLNVLMNSDVDLLYVNNYWFLDSYKQKPRKNNKRGVTTFENSLSFSRHTNVMLTYLSGFIVRSGIGGNYRRDLAGSNLVQLSWVLPLLRDGKNFMTINDWVIAAKGSNSGGYGLVNVFGNNLKSITDDILKDNLPLAKTIQNGTILNFFPGLIMSFRNGKSRFSDKDMAIGLQKVFGDNWRYYVFISPLINMPLSLSRLYYLFVRLLAKFAGRFVI
jgi:abequosyltransferase